jgi:hypothetical protein
MKSRFVVNFGTFFLPNVKSISKPSVDITTKEYKLLNHNFNYPGVAKWNPITVTFICMNPKDAGILEKGLDTAHMLSRILTHSGYKTPDTSGSGLSTSEKLASGINSFGTELPAETPAYVPGKDNSIAPGTVMIQQIGSDGGPVVEQWELHGPIIKSITFGDLSYDSDDFVEYTLEIMYDYAKHSMASGSPIVNDEYSKFS